MCPGLVGFWGLLNGNGWYMWLRKMGVKPSLKLTAFQAPENGWLEYFIVSFWGKRPIFSSYLSFRECKTIASILLLISVFVSLYVHLYSKYWDVCVSIYIYICTALHLCLYFLDLDIFIFRYLLSYLCIYITYYVVLVDRIPGTSMAYL